MRCSRSSGSLTIRHRGCGRATMSVPSTVPPSSRSSDAQLEAAKSIARRVRAGSGAARLRCHHDRDSRGPGVLLRRRLSPAVSRQEPRRLLRAWAGLGWRVRRVSRARRRDRHDSLPPWRNVARCAHEPITSRKDLAAGRRSPDRSLQPTATETSCRGSPAAGVRTVSARRPRRPNRPGSEPWVSSGN